MDYPKNNVELPDSVSANAHQAWMDDFLNGAENRLRNSTNLSERADAPRKMDRQVIEPKDFIPKLGLEAGGLLTAMGCTKIEITGTKFEVSFKDKSFYGGASLDKKVSFDAERSDGTIKISNIEGVTTQHPIRAAELFDGGVKITYDVNGEKVQEDKNDQFGLYKVADSVMKKLKK